jgi:UDP-N-acetylglucosamine transferase subunit ALG13
MIFVSVGTHEAPFDRLLTAVDELELDEVLVVQCGPSAIRPVRATCVEYLPFEEVVEHIRSSRAVVSHAGVGSVMIALANGRRPIVVPRLQRFGEHVDDHQLELGLRMSAAGLVTLVEDPARLGNALRAPAEAVSTLTGEPWLGEDLREYLSVHLAGRPVLASAGR